MADSQSEKVKKHKESRTKAEAELKKYLQQLMDKAERKVRVERLVKSGGEAMTKAIVEHKLLYSFADKTTDPDAFKNDLESWRSDVTVENDEVLKSP